MKHVEELAAHFEDHEPNPDAVHDATTLREVRQAFLARAESERRLTEAVEMAAAEGHTWDSIGAMIGTSGEAARQNSVEPSDR